MHIVNMEVFALGPNPGETNRLATAVIGERESSWEAEQLIEQINQGEFPDQLQIERLKKSLASFYGKTRILAFVYTKQTA